MAAEVAKAAPDLRLAELMAALSLATDLGDGFPLEKALRDAVLAVGLARELGLDGPELSDVYYVALLEHLGCTANAHEIAADYGGDDIAIRHHTLALDIGRPGEVFAKTFQVLIKDFGPIEAASILARMLRGPWRTRTASTCEAADRLARRLGMSEGVRQGLAHVYARWDGKGFPGVSGEHIALSARIVHLAHLVETLWAVGGQEAAEAMVRRRRRGDFDPAVADAFLQNAAALVAQMDAPSIWESALAAEPEFRPWLPASKLDEIARAFADFVDLKSPFMLGHSSGVAKRAEAAGRALGMDDADLAALRRSGLLHDLGRVSVPNGIWDKTGRLTEAEWERVRLHPYYSERIMSHSPALQPLGHIVGMHHERLDGSGYHHAVTSASIPKTARVLAAADAYQAMGEERPHRPALSPIASAERLNDEVKAGRLDREAVNAVLESAGHTLSRERASWPAGLTDREVEVLRLVAKAKPDREIARVLFISPNTVHHHVKQIYEKAGVSSRAGAALFAMEHDLIFS